MTQRVSDPSFSKGLDSLVVIFNIERTAFSVLQFDQPFCPPPERCTDLCP